MDEKKETLTIQVGDNESSKYWLSALNDLKNRGVKNILILCADGLPGIKETLTLHCTSSAQYTEIYGR